MQKVFKLIASLHLFANFTGMPPKVLLTGQGFACVIWPDWQRKPQQCGVCLNPFFIVLMLKTTGLQKKELPLLF